MSVPGNEARERHLPSAPRFSPIPQSPSPTIVSYFVTSGSTEISLSSAVVKVDLARLGSTMQCQRRYDYDSQSPYL
jgi:hypothetical protein